MEERIFQGPGGLRAGGWHGKNKNPTYENPLIGIKVIRDENWLLPKTELIDLQLPKNAFDT